MSAILLVMPNERTPYGRGRPAVEPSEVQISVTVAPGRGDRLRQRLASRRPILSASDPTYATARVDRAGGCARYRGYVNASFHWIDAPGGCCSTRDSCSSPTTS